MRPGWYRLAICLLATSWLAACAHTAPAPRARVYHVVLCWLKAPGDPVARQRIIDASKTFRTIPGVIDVKAGPSIPSHRAIVDDSFDVGILLTFPDRQAMRAYLTHPDHKRAVRRVLRPLVRKIIVYDFADQPG